MTLNKNFFLSVSFLQQPYLPSFPSDPQFRLFDSQTILEEQWIMLPYLLSVVRPEAFCHQLPL